MVTFIIVNVILTPSALLAALRGPKVSPNNGGGVIVSRLLKSRGDCLCGLKDLIEEKMAEKSVLLLILWTAGIELPTGTPPGDMAKIQRRLRQ